MTAGHAHFLSVLDEGVWGAIAAHAEASAPDECCGYVTAAGVRRCENVQDRLHAEDPVLFPRTARTAFRLAARDQLALARSFDGPDPARVLYHSHVGSGTHFSAADLAGATFEGAPLYPGLVHVVVSVHDGRATEAAAYVLADGGAQRVGLFDLSAGRAPRPPAGTNGPDAPRSP